MDYLRKHHTTEVNDTMSQLTLFHTSLSVHTSSAESLSEYSGCSLLFCSQYSEYTLSIALWDKTMLEQTNTYPMLCNSKYSIADILMV